MVHACIGSCMHQVLQLQNLCLIANRHRIHGTQYSLGHSTHWDTVLIGTQYSLGHSTHWDTVLIGTQYLLGHIGLKCLSLLLTTICIPAGMPCVAPCSGTVGH